jgi:predicted GNAT superfamily acetyltransferase
VSGIEIRLLESVGDFRRAEALQRVVWDSGPLDVVPLHALTAVAHNGGLVLGAFDAAELVGFSWGFLGTDEGDPSRPALSRLKFHSHMTGVRPDYRNAGIGHRLKLAQREHVIRLGVRLVTWTFDPLESRNANLNIARLRAISRTYLREIYGKMEDGLNAGLPSDRFQVEWWVTSQRVKQGLAEEPARHPLTLDSVRAAGAQVLNPTEFTADGLLRPPERFAAATGGLALVEIPAEFQRLKVQAMPLAQAWRARTREAFEGLFAREYYVIDFLHQAASPNSPARSFYLLSPAAGRIGVLDG